MPTIDPENWLMRKGTVLLESVDLLEFVYESNAIEDIHTRSLGIPYVRDHLIAAQKAARNGNSNRLVKPTVFHRILMAKLLPSNQVGMWRKINVRVGNYVAPDWRRVPELIDTLWNRVCDADSPANAPDWCWGVHHEFESIHPFVDGNGRVGRLLLNNLRLVHDLPWLTIKATEREAYYRSIEQWRKKNWERGKT